MANPPSPLGLQPLCRSHSSSRAPADPCTPEPDPQRPRRDQSCLPHTPREHSGLYTSSPSRLSSYFLKCLVSSKQDGREKSTRHICPQRLCSAGKGPSAALGSSLPEPVPRTILLLNQHLGSSLHQGPKDTPGTHWGHPGTQRLVRSLREALTPGCLRIPLLQPPAAALLTMLSLACLAAAAFRLSPGQWGERPHCTTPRLAMCTAESCEPLRTSANRPHRGHHG